MHFNPSTLQPFNPAPIHIDSKDKMSGLEPLAALGLACNVFQVLGFAGDVCKFSRHVFEHGQAPEPAVALARASGSLTKAFHDAEAIATAATQPLAQRDHELLKIARECNNAAKALQDEVDNNTAKTAKAKGKLVESAVAGVQSLASSRKKKIRELERLLEVHRDTLETRLLVNIWFVTQPRPGWSYSALPSEVKH